MDFFGRSLWGFALWGKPTEADLKRIVPLLVLELDGEAVPHASLVDVRRLEAADPRAFAVQGVGPSCAAHDRPPGKEFASLRR